MIIIGGGIGGVSTYIQLHSLGYKVAIIDDSNVENFVVGESLPGNAGNLLAKLGLETILNNNELVKEYSENISAWGSNSLNFSDFIFSPYGKGWHLNRTLFNFTILEIAIGKQSPQFDFRNTRCTDLIECIEHENCWKISIHNVENVKSQQILHSKWIVDACGRRMSAVKKISPNFQPQIFDKLIAFYAVFQSKSESKQSNTLVESCKDGWWYTASLPNDKRVVVFHTDDDLPIAKQMKNESNFMKFLEQTEHCHSLLLKEECEVIQQPMACSANSKRLHQFCKFETKKKIMNLMVCFVCANRFIKGKMDCDWRFCNVL